MSEIIFKSTAAAKEHAETLKRAASGFQEFDDKISAIYDRLNACWEGDSQDFTDIIYSIGGIAVDSREISQCLNELSLGLSSFASAVDELGKGNSEAGVATGAAIGDVVSQNKGFWDRQKDEFANDWDYSQCDGALDYVGQTIGGVIGTIGSTVNFITDGIGEIFKWIF